MIFKIKKAVDELYLMIRGHIGQGQEAHTIATKINHGFLSAQDKEFYDSARGKRIWKNPIGDPSLLNPGSYVGTGLEKGPTIAGADNAIFLVDVSAIDYADITGLKEIIVTRSFDGKKWVKSYHTQGGRVANEQWRILQQRTILFEGAAKYNDVLTLNDDLSQYEYLIFENNYGSVTQVRTSVNTYQIREVNLANASNSASWDFNEMLVTKTSNTKLTVSSCRRYAWNNNQNVSVTENYTTVNIKRIVGIK